MSGKILSIVIPTFNRKDDLKACIENLLLQDIEVDNHEIIVVDNGPSTDGTAVYMQDIAEKYEHISYIQTTEKGVIAARNLGFLNANGKIFLTLDDDVEFLNPDALSLLVETFSDTDIAMVGGVELKNSVARPSECFQDEKVGHVNRWGNITTSFESLDGCNKTIDVMHFRSCCMAIKADVFKKIGGFKKIYNADGMGFRYETDFCLRAIKYGRVVIDPKIRVWHKAAPRSRGFSRGKGEGYMYLANRNHMYFMLTFFWSKYSFVWICYDIFIGNFRTPGLLYCIKRRFFSPKIIIAAIQGKLEGVRMHKIDSTTNAD